MAWSALARAVSPIIVRRKYQHRRRTSLSSSTQRMTCKRRRSNCSHPRRVCSLTGVQRKYKRRQRSNSPRRNSSRSCEETSLQHKATMRDAALFYGPLAAVLDRLDELHARRENKEAQRWLIELVLRLANVPAILSGRPADVRFVAVADTHRFHNSVELPAGEVLLFAGDAVGNFGRSSDISAHFEEFLEWLRVQSKRFAWVFFIVGNHETHLDARCGEISAGLEQLRRFLHAVPNCTYLENAAAVYRGLHLFGSPVTVSRMETEGKRYYSNAFERSAEERAAIWAELPDGLDVLMTHCPPRGRLCRDAVGCPQLTARLAKLASPPHFHVFGHDHKCLGVESDEHTVYMNVAQDQCLRLDPHGGGCPLVFDVEARG